MKVIIINRKRLGVTIIIIGLMLVLFGLEKNFDSRLKFTTLMQNNIKSLTQYETLDKRFSYKLPSEWITKEQNFPGNEIIYHNDFNTKDLKINGFVEVWNLNKDLKTFLEESKKISSEQNLYKSYEMKSLTINNKDGYLLEYTIISATNKNYKGYEYFIRKKDKFFRFSFFVSENNFKENMPTIFKTIVQTFSYKDQ